MHSTFNANNKHDGREMMKNAEKHDALNKHQFGGRKNHQAIRAALGKRLTMDLMRQKVRAGSMISNDAKSCFDRILHLIAFLCMARQGISYTALTSMFLTLQNAHHHVRTAFGVSKTSYGGKKHHQTSLPSHGIGQGNGAATACWAVISSILITLMVQAGLCATFTMALSASILTVACLAFVDDTDLFFTARTPTEPGEALFTPIQKMLDHWNGYLRATGGALVPSKSFWYLIDFKWDGEDYQYRTIQEMPGNITMCDIDGIAITQLTRHEPDHPEIMLGIAQAPDGNNEGAVGATQTTVF